MSDKPCPACEGKRLKPESLAVTVAGRNIADVCALSVERGDRVLRAGSSSTSASS